MNQSDILQVQLNLDKPDIVETKVGILTNLIEIQRSSIRSKDDRYMIGLYNGLVLAKSVLTDKEPVFYESEREEVNNG